MTNHLATISLLLAIIIACLGCAPTLLDARNAVNLAADTYADVEPRLEKQRREEGDVCFLDTGPPGAAAVQTCLAAVRARWAPVIAATYAVHAAILAAQSAVGAAEVAAALHAKPDMVRLFAVIYRAIDAAAQLDAAVSGLLKPVVQPVPSSSATPSPRR